MSAPGALGALRVLNLGRVEYEDGLALQRLFGQARTRGLVEDTLLLLEHPPVLTLGRGAKAGNIVVPRAQLEALGVAVFDTNRGGDVTYHGPGQVVGYPVFQLPPGRQDVRRYVRDVEECVIRALGAFGLAAARIPRWPGVWLGSEAAGDARKVGAIGVHISRWVTSHGFALNVNTDLSHFGLIVPCGIHEAGVTSMEKELGGPVPLGDVQAELAAAFGEVFGGTLRVDSGRMQTVSVAVLRPSGAGPQVLVLERTPERGGFHQLVTGRVEPGESAAQAARRELCEETGLDEEPVALGYRHAFALGEELPPRLVEESAFAVHVPAGTEPRLGPEHSGAQWLGVGAALERLPFAGLREAVRRAARLPGR